MTKRKFEEKEFIAFCEKQGVDELIVLWWVEDYNFEESGRQLSELFQEEDWDYSVEEYEERILRYFPSLEAHELYNDYIWKRL